MTQSLPFIIYIHGFNSSPSSEKARQFSQYCQKLGLESLEVPALSYDPEVAITRLESLIESQLTSRAGITGRVKNTQCTENTNKIFLVGSSLGGYYATWLAEKFGCRAALINPAVSPLKTLGEEFLGPQENLYTGEKYEFTRQHALYLGTLDVNPVRRPENFLLMVQTGDAVLDYRIAVNRYAGSKQIVQQGGSHRFENFDQMIPAILTFAETGMLDSELQSMADII